MFTVPVHSLMTHPCFILISPRFMLHSDLCQEPVLPFVKSAKVMVCVYVYPSIIVLHIVIGKTKTFFRCSRENLLNCCIKDDITDH